MKKIIPLLIAVSLLSACSKSDEIAETSGTDSVETTASIGSSESLAANAETEENSAGKYIEDCLNSYREYVILDYNAVCDENDEFIWVYSETDDPDYVESWYQIESPYTLDEIKERAGKILTGQQLESHLSTLDLNLRVDEDKLYMRYLEMNFPYPISDNWEILTETAEILDQSETTLKIQAKTWDTIYEADYISVFTLKLEDGVWKIAEYSLDLPY